MQKFRSLGWLALPLATLTSVQAAEMTVTQYKKGYYAVNITGDIELGDADTFKQLTAKLPNDKDKVTVVLSSDGGKALTGMMIGETIHGKNFSTFIPANVACNSICAIMWLSGTKRFTTEDSYIGFHAAYNSETKQDTGVINALLGAYLTKLGLGYAAIEFMTRASMSQNDEEHQITWLHPADAHKFGITSIVIEKSKYSTLSRPFAGKEEKYPWVSSVSLVCIPPFTSNVEKSPIAIRIEGRFNKKNGELVHLYIVHEISNGTEEAFDYSWKETSTERAVTMPPKTFEYPWKETSRPALCSPCWRMWFKSLI